MIVQPRVGSVGRCPTLPPDEELPALAESLDARQVANWFEQTGRGRVLDCALKDTKYLPRVRCVSSYRLLRDAGRGPEIAFGAVRVTSAGVEVHWHDEDPGLPWLCRAGDAAVAAAALRACGAGDINGVIATPVRYRPGVRAVVRYDAVTPRGAATFFGRLYADSADLYAETHRALAALPGVDGRTGHPLVSPPLGVLPELHLALERAAPGRSASAPVFDASVAVARRLAVCRSIGGALAALHTSRGVVGPLRVMGDDLRELRGLLSVVAHVDPVLAESVLRLIDTLDLTGEIGSWVPSHGAMRTDQVLVTDDGRVTLLDLDGYCWADPGRDIGNVLAYLRWRAIREPEQARFAARVREGFLAGYRERVDVDRVAAARYEAASVLKIAVRRYRNLRVAEWPLVPRLLGAAAGLIDRRRRDERVVAAPWVRDPAPRVQSHTRSSRPLPPRPPASSRLLLRQASDLAIVGSELVAVTGSAGETRALHPLSAGVLSCRSAQRALLRYVLTDDSGAQVVVFGKLFAERARAARTHRTLAALHEQVYASSDDLTVPEPLGLLTSLPLSVYRPAPGRYLDEVLQRPTAAAGVAGAARWLAALHAAPVVLERRLDMDKELTNVVTWATLVAERSPEDAVVAARLVKELRQLAGRLGELRAVPIHKDFHHRHVVVDGRVAVIDFDEVRLGPPQLDVAHFCAYLELLRLRIATPATVERLRRAFLEQYATCTGWRPDDAHRFFFGWACLKVARQLATGRGLDPRPVGVERARQVRDMLTQGLAWLG